MADPVLIGVAGTLLGILITRSFDVFRWRREDRRWQAEPYRQHRCDALIELHRSLTACLPSYLLGDAPSETNQWRSHFKARLVDAHRAAVLAKPYLTKEEGTAVAETLLKFRSIEKAFLDFAAAQHAEALDQASALFMKRAEPYVSVYLSIVEYLEPMIVPRAVEDQTRRGRQLSSGRER